MNKTIFSKFTLILILLSGCSTQPLLPPAPNSIASKVIFLNELSDIAFGDLRSIAVNGFLTVEAELINNSSSSNSLQYRFQWRDKNGMAVGVEETWKVLNFSPSQAQHIKGIATSKQAVDFKLELQSNN